MGRREIGKVGDTVTINVTPDCADNTSPVYGDTRMVPTSFRIRNGYDTKYTGTFSADFTTAQFNTSKIPVGLNTLVVTFTRQSFDGTKWIDTSYHKNLSQNFTVAGSVRAVAATPATQTGDNTVLFVIAGVAMLLAAATFTAVVLKKKKVR